MSARLSLVAAFAALIAAGAIAAVAVEVRDWQTELESGDVGFVGDPLTPGLWSGPSGAAGDVARRLLGIADDLRFRQAEREFARGDLPASTFELERARLTARGRAAVVLESVMRDDNATWRRARAATLLGVGAYEDALVTPESSGALVRRALRMFRLAARTDPAADDAKTDLELLLTTLRSERRKGRQRDADQGTSGGFGAGLADPGSGY